MFLGGSTYRPELLIQDYSGFVDAANMRSASMARLGAKISGAAKDYQDKKDAKEANKLFDETLLGFAKQDSAIGESLRSMGLVDLESIAAARKGLGRKQMLEFINFLAEEEVKSQAPSLKPVSDSSMRSAEARVAEMGFEYNPEARTFQKTVGPGFLRSLGNIVSPGQPFGSPRTVDLPQEVIDTTTGLPQLLEQKRAVDNVEMIPMQDDDDPLGFFPK